MAEVITLTTPVVPANPTTSTWKLVKLDLDLENSYIFMKLKSNTGEVFMHEYDGTKASTLMIALNKANLTVKSLQKRCLEQLIADGIKLGTVTGTVD